ncbi:hypothetical protein ACTQZK_01545 [Paraeggerthella sp. LCP19S3_G8]|uniref:hypothetical protein n=1 Tax=unclassified Paraeggerthella TaxID=2641972 RepID=UPI003A8F655F
MPYETSVSTLAQAIAQEGAAWVMCALVVIVCAALLSKGFPAWSSYMDRRAAVEEERERRKARESEERARTEGQWIQAIDRSNDVSESVAAALESSTRMIDRVSCKLDEDARQAERNAAKLDRLETDMQVLLERTKK